MLTQHEISLQEHRNWFEEQQRNKTRQLLIVMEGAEPIGFVQFSPTHQVHVSDWGFYARPEASKGSGKKLGQAALTYAFQELGLHKVCGQAIESNTASITLHQKLGFKEEGRLSDHQKMAGQSNILFCFGLGAKDWQQRQQTESKPDAPN